MESLQVKIENELKNTNCHQIPGRKVQFHTEELKPWDRIKNSLECFKVAVSMRHCLNESFYQDLGKKYSSDKGGVVVKYSFHSDHDVVVFALVPKE